MANETFTVTETIVLKPGGGDADGDNVIDPGEIVRTTVTITNNSTTPTPVDAIGLQFSQTLNGMTLFDQVGLGDINVSPIAFGDSYTAVGNTLLEVGNATGQTGPQSSIAGHVTDNDLEFFGGTFTISAFQATSAQGGAVTMITSGADMGSFTYVSNDGFTGTDTFTYTIRDTGLDGIAGNSDDLTSTATVTITVANKVWYVDNAAGPGGDGTSTNPFNSLADVSGATGPDAAGDIIYVNTGNSAYAGGVTLLDNQTLHGEGTALVVGGFTLAAAGTDATIVNAVGNGVTVEQGNTLTGFTVGNTTGYDIANTTTATVGTLNISNVTLNGTGGLIRADSGGTINATLDSATSTGGSTSAILLSNVDNSSFTVTGTTAIDDATADGILIQNSDNSTFTFTGGVTILNDGGANGDGVDLLTNTGSTLNFNGGVNITVNGASAFGFRAQSSGTVNILDPGTTQITSNNGTALLVNPTTLNATLDSLTSGGGAQGISLTGMSGSLSIGTVGINGQSGNGVEVINSTGSLTINGGSIGNSNDPGGDAFHVFGGTGAVTVAASLTKTSAGNIVDVQNHGTGAISFSGNLSATGGVNNGMLLNNNASGNITFSGASKVLNTGTSNAVTISSNGANIDFTGGNLDIDTTSGIGIAAGTIGIATGGTLTVSGSGNTITSTTGSAFVLNGTDSDGITFQSISRNGGTATAIFIKDAGTGGFTVTGTGSTANSGGTIQNVSDGGSDFVSTVGVGLYVENTSNISLSNMLFGNGTTMGNFSIRGQNVTNFTLRDSVLNGLSGDMAGDPVPPDPAVARLEIDHIFRRAGRRRPVRGQLHCGRLLRQFADR